MIWKFLWLQLLLFFTLRLFGQGIAGKITDGQGEPLPYATIYVSKIQKGTASNEDGFYQLELSPGSYEVVYQYLGYKTEQRTVEVGTASTSVNITLTVEPTQLQTIEVNTNNEDPAYTIMRKAIAKAKYHTQQLDEYTAISYIKGSGRLKKLPWMFRKVLEREMKESGIDTATAFVTESVNEIHYQRPNQFTEKVISVRKIGNDNNTSPNGFINSSFYAPEMNGAVSPLSPKAFAHYKFEYLGFTAERGYNINKILVTPRSPGDQVFDGIIYIVDNLWCLHSVDLTTYVWGIRFDIDQVYQPIDSTVWMPVNQIFDVSGSLFGFGFEYKYFANIKDYDITLNPDLTFEPEVIDDKLEAEVAKQADQNFKNNANLEETFTALEGGEEISRKQLRKVLKEYEKQELEDFQQDTLEDVVSIYNQEIDSLAYDRDSTYWSEMRPIPLTNYEVKGYRVMDSISIVEEQKSEEKGGRGDSTSTGNSNGISGALGLLAGDNSWKFADHWRFGYPSIFSQFHFNTVEGWHMTFMPYLSYSDEVTWKLQPEIHYGFSREVFNGGVSSSFSWGEKGMRNSLSVEAVSRVLQINEEEPIHPLVNDLFSLLFKRNYMKLLEKSYVGLSWSKDISEVTNFRVFGQYFQKNPLENNTYQVFFKNDRPYTDNEVPNIENESTGFDSYEGMVAGLSFSIQPWQSYRIRNGRKQRIEGSSPTFDFQFSTGINDLFESTLSYQHLEFGYRHFIALGARGDLHLDVKFGTFLNADNLPFPEYKHFPGNRTFLSISEPVGSYRLLDYYKYSTSGSYLEAHGHYQFRKFLLTQLVLARLAGLRENLFFSLLETQSSNHYFEVGYGVNYIFRFFRLELVSSFEDFKYKDFGVRVGVATNFESIFN